MPVICYQLRSNLMGNGIPSNISYSYCFLLTDPATYMYTLKDHVSYHSRKHATVETIKHDCVNS